MTRYPPTSLELTTILNRGPGEWRRTFHFLGKTSSLFRRFRSRSTLHPSDGQPYFGGVAYNYYDHRVSKIGRRRRLFPQTRSKAGQVHFNRLV